MSIILCNFILCIDLEIGYIAVSSAVKLYENI